MDSINNPTAQNILNFTEGPQGLSHIPLTLEEAEQRIRLLYHLHQMNSTSFGWQTFNPCTLNILDCTMTFPHNVYCTWQGNTQWFWLTEPTKGALQDALISTWIHIGNATTPLNWDIGDLCATSCAELFEKWNQEDICYPDPECNRPTLNIWQYPYEMVTDLRTHVQHYQWWMTAIRSIVDLYRLCNPTTGNDGLHRLHIHPLHASSTFQAAARTEPFTHFICAMNIAAPLNPNQASIPVIQESPSGRVFSTPLDCSPPCYPTPDLLNAPISQPPGLSIPTPDQLASAIENASPASTACESCFPMLDPLAPTPHTYATSEASLPPTYSRAFDHPELPAQLIQNNDTPITASEITQSLTNTVDNIMNLINRIIGTLPANEQVILLDTASNSPSTSSCNMEISESASEGFSQNPGWLCNSLPLPSLPSVAPSNTSDSAIMEVEGHIIHHHGGEDYSEISNLANNRLSSFPISAERSTLPSLLFGTPTFLLQAERLYEPIEESSTNWHHSTSFPSIQEWQGQLPQTWPGSPTLHSLSTQELEEFAEGLKEESPEFASPAHSYSSASPTSILANLAYEDAVQLQLESQYSFHASNEE